MSQPGRPRKLVWLVRSDQMPGFDTPEYDSNLPLDPASLPYEMNSPAVSVLRRRGSATAQTQRRIVAFASRFLAQNPHLPFPKIDGRGGVEKRFAGTQLKLAQGSGTSGPSKAAELQALHMEDKADVLPAENGAENLIQFVQRGSRAPR